MFLEAISKIADHVQEQGVSRRKSAAYEQYVSILRRFTTKLLGVRCIFEIGSNTGEEKESCIPITKNEPEAG